MTLVITKFNPGLINDVQSLRILILTLLSDLNSLTLTCDEVCMTVCEQLKLHIYKPHRNVSGYLAVELEGD